MLAARFVVVKIAKLAKRELRARGSDRTTRLTKREHKRSGNAVVSPQMLPLVKRATVALAISGGFPAGWHGGTDVGNAVRMRAGQWRLRSRLREQHKPSPATRALANGAFLTHVFNHMERELMQRLVVLVGHDTKISDWPEDVKAVLAQEIFKSAQGLHGVLLYSLAYFKFLGGRTYNWRQSPESKGGKRRGRPCHKSDPMRPRHRSTTRTRPFQSRLFIDRPE